MTKFIRVRNRTNFDDAYWQAGYIFIGKLFVDYDQVEEIDEKLDLVRIHSLDSVREYLDDE